MNNSEHCRRFCIQYSQVECNYCISCNTDGRTCRCRVQLASQISSLYTGHSIAHILVEFSLDATFPLPALRLQRNLNMNNEQPLLEERFQQRLLRTRCLWTVRCADANCATCKTKKQLNDIASKCPLMVKLQGVTDSLKHVDFPLYNHLQCLDIPVETRVSIVFVCLFVCLLSNFNLPYCVSNEDRRLLAQQCFRQTRRRGLQSTSGIEQNPAEKLSAVFV
ncbi:hypothetical protein Tsp_01652 [Trichinella spiralis]|uniref:hypothetical protein n=1 Tax=Trichinella spiralis TaxID=6334 RepID=UPI0001EFC497|nr:hypothetical protein Tsp_01652 [Trichinella spiralis]